MQNVSMALGLVVLLGMFAGLVPCLGWLNWLNIPLALAALIVSTIAMVNHKVGPPTRSVVGMVLSVIAVVVGALRLLLGGGLA
jgi:hypothetical protein